MRNRGNSHCETYPTRSRIPDLSADILAWPQIRYIVQIVQGFTNYGVRLGN